MGSLFPKVVIGQAFTLIPAVTAPFVSKGTERVVAANNSCKLLRFNCLQVLFVRT